MTNGMELMVICDGGLSSYLGLLPWLSILIVPAIAVRSLFLLRCRRSEKARKVARLCFLGLHLQSGFCMISATCLSLGAWFSVAKHFGHGAVLLAMQNLNMSHMLWAVVFQCFIATLAAIVVVACSGFCPRFWQPRYTIASIVLCAIAQVISLGLFGIMKN